MRREFSDQPSDDSAGFIVYRGAKPLYVSKGWAKIHGYDVEDIMAMPSIEPLCHPNDRKRMTAYAVERAAGRYAYRVLHRQGGYIWVDVQVEAIH